MTADKILKYDVIEKLTKFNPIEKGVSDFISTETVLENNIQPENVNLSEENNPDSEGK